MELIWNYLKDTVLYVLGTLLHNLPALLLGILVAAAIQTYVNADKMRSWLMRRSSVSIPATVAFGAFTPFCACGTMAVVLSMLATSLPWGPIMAFLTSSPLMSPDGFVLISGIISPAFAIALAAASVIIGLGSGYATHVIEKKTSFLKNQLRIAPAAAASKGCRCSASPSPEVPAAAVCCDSAKETSGCSGCGKEDISMQGCCGVIVQKPLKLRIRAFLTKYRIDRLFKAAFDVGIKKILPYFALFAGIGYLINRFIPSEWITALFGSRSAFAVPLAAVVGLPLYVNSSSSIPLIQSLMQSGVSGGAMLAFMITGPGTSAGVLAGIATIMKKKAIALYVAFLLFGAILLGYAYELIMALVK
jgi:uncharacterized membrane protein YraQ (UPF0718 family)